MAIAGLLPTRTGLGTAARRHCLVSAGRSAAVWATAASASLLLTVSEALGQQLPQGRALLLVVALALVVADAGGRGPARPGAWPWSALQRCWDSSCRR